MTFLLYISGEGGKEKGRRSIAPCARAFREKKGEKGSHSLHYSPKKRGKGGENEREKERFRHFLLEGKKKNSSEICTICLNIVVPRRRGGGERKGRFLADFAIQNHGRRREGVGFFNLQLR